MYLQPRKACPRCQSAAPLTAAQCLTCGHHYRTLFVPPQMAPITNPTRKMYAFAVTTSESKAAHFALSLFLAALAIAATRFGMQIATQTAPVRAHSFHRVDPMHKTTPPHLVSNSAPLESILSDPSGN